MLGVDKTTVIKALKEDCIPILRKAEFKGSFPHFYRVSDDFVALINFQFSRYGGRFCVNISYADPARRNVFFRPETEPKRLQVAQTSERRRLGKTKRHRDQWYSFGKTSYGEIRGDPIPLEQITLMLNELFQSDAETWWREKKLTNS